MSAKYQATYTIPEGYPALLKMLSREILRAQPDNIYEFAARLFADLQARGSDQASTSAAANGVPAEASSAESGPLSARDPDAENMLSNATQLDLAHLTASELEPMILKMFVAADKDHNGFLDRSEFELVLRSANMNISARTLRQILAEADEDDDHRIQYKEFLPVIVDLLQSIKAAEQATGMMSGVDNLVRAEVEDVLLHGLPKQELEKLMLKVFQKADADDSGLLNRKEFKSCLRAAELGLTRRDINSILSKVDVDGDGAVSYKEFIPVCFEVLVERFKDEVVISDILSNQDGLQGLLLRSFQEADVEEAGILPMRVVKQVLKTLSFQMLGLSTLQIVSLLSQAPCTADGLIQYVQFVPLAASMIYSMYDVDSMKLRLQAIKAAAEAGGMGALRTMDIEALRNVLEQAFARADVDGTGQLTPPQVREVFESLGTSGTSPMLSSPHLRAMFAAIDTDDSGTVEWNELVEFVCDTIEHIEREQYIKSVAEEQGASAANVGSSEAFEDTGAGGAEAEQSFAGEEEAGAPAEPQDNEQQADDGQVGEQEQEGAYEDN